MTTIANKVWNNAIILMGTVASLGVSVAQAASGYWNGTESAYWTNSANWSESAYPSGSDTASFTNAGNTRTTINIEGLENIKTVVFDSANAAAYTIGNGGANAQTLTTVADGQIILSSSLTSDQTIAAALQFSGGTSTIANNSATRTLTLNRVSNTVSGAGLNLNGVGAISVLGNLSADSGNLPLSINGSGAVTLSGNNNQLRSLALNSANAVLNLPEGSMTYFNSGDNLYVSQNSVINGPGAMVLYRGGGEDYANNSVANGKTLTVNAKLTGETGFEDRNGSNFGTIALLGQNDFTLNVIMNAAGTLVVTNIGNQASTTSNLGAGTKVIFNSTMAEPHA